ncbi:hypothetical protein CSKR_103341 [Clonorchis sinensis]|uniref:Uncharacterized protein n=1 Tax=Clonorchis sinensis TaxID=79923 RepID=A0A3R7C186_CLOSI|nr:hypothetical protein CSKR_103341 [Clonorchis sinensis]
MCCTRPPHVPVATIFDISRYMYIRNALLIRLLKILRQPTTGFALLGAHQVSLWQNQTDLQISVFIELSPIWVQVEHKVDGNSGTAPT